MSDPRDGWTGHVSFSALRYVHDDGSEIAKIDEPAARHFCGKWVLYIGDPPTDFGFYATPDEAMAAHADGEWREHMRSEP